MDKTFGLLDCGVCGYDHIQFGAASVKPIQKSNLSLIHENKTFLFLWPLWNA
jgi:hypothetical protein